MRYALVIFPLIVGLPRAAAQAIVWPTHGWPHSSPEAQGMDSRTLADAFDYIHQRNIPIHSLLIIRNGYIVLDAYFWPFADGQQHDLASVTKSVTSTLAGIAIGEHRLDLHHPIVTVFAQRAIANRDQRKDRVTIENLLTMTSGLECHADQGEITLSHMMASANWTQFVLDLPMTADPGSHFEYCSPGMHLLSGVITQATGASALDFARRVLFGPLGISEVAWPVDAQGISHGWGDLHLQPRDMAKLGLLWLNGGRWENRQIIPADWMRAAIEVHSHPGDSDGQEYGFGIWVYPNRTPPEFEGLGRGGQRISVLPALNLIVVFTGGGFEPGDVGNFIGRAIKANTVLPADTAGAARLEAAMRAATRPPRAQPLQPAPALARAISGKSYTFDDNALNLRALTLTFAGGSEAELQLELGDRHDGPRPVGLDGVPRVSPAGRFGLPVAISGAWESDSTFTLDYDEIANINTYHLRLTFTSDNAVVELSSRSRAVSTSQFRGRARGGRATKGRD